MLPPNVQNIRVDSKANVKYVVMAYRELTDEEIVESVRAYLRQRKGKKPKPGETVVIVTIIGYDS